MQEHKQNKHDSEHYTHDKQDQQQNSEQGSEQYKHDKQDKQYKQLVLHLWEPRRARILFANRSRLISSVVRIARPFLTHRLHQLPQ